MSSRRSIIQGILVLALLSSAAVTWAPQNPMEAASAQMIGPILKLKPRSVVVFDFSGPGEKVSELGVQLAEELRSALSQSSTKLQLDGRSQIEEVRKRHSYAPELVADLTSAFIFAQELHAADFVIGKISLGQGNMLTVELSAYTGETGAGIKGVTVSFPRTDAMASLMANAVPSFGSISDSYPRYELGKRYTAPVCIFCPRAEYGPDAQESKIEGTVELIAAIGTDGLVKDVAVRKALPAGLTESALRAVARWKLKPAVAPDGNPTVVVVPIEISFLLK